MSLDAQLARRLGELSPTDWDWLFGQLSAEDCERITQGFRLSRTQAGMESASAGQINAASLTPSIEATVEPMARLSAATAREMKAVLVGQPDWAVALALSAQSASWAQEILKELAPGRIQTLRTLAQELIPQTTQQLRAALLRTLAMKLVPAGVDAPALPIFDDALSRAVSEMAATSGGQRS